MVLVERMPCSNRRQKRGEYSLADIAELLGVGYQTLRYHSQQGYLPKPSIGREAKRYYSLEQVAEIKEYWGSR